MADIDLAEMERRDDPRFFEPNRTISHDEAREIAQRFINMHFNNEGEHSRASIPADQERDDDLLICAYIAQRRREETALSSRVRALEAALREAEHDAMRYRYLREHCCSHYPMTHDQPAEWSIEWGFQQITPDERYGSFDKWIDRDIERLDLDARAALTAAQGESRQDATDGGTNE